MAGSLAGAAHAQTSCSALILPEPNLGQAPPGNVLDPAETVTIEIFVLNTCLIAGADAAAKIRGTTTITLACTSAQPCVGALPGSFENTSCAPEAQVACAVSVDQNVVTLTYTGTNDGIMNTKVLPPFPTFTKLATITTDARLPQTPDPTGFFELNAVTNPGDVFTSLASGSGQGSAPFFFPGGCGLEIDRQVSCDGVNFIDVRDVDDLGNLGTELCTTAPGQEITVRHVARNTGLVDDLVNCTLTDTNVALGASQPIGTILQGDSFSVDTKGTCSDIEADEPAMASVLCRCSVAGFDVTDQDVAGFDCADCPVPASPPWSQWLLAGLLLGLLSLWSLRGARVPAD